MPPESADCLGLWLQQIPECRLRSGRRKSPKGGFVAGIAPIQSDLPGANHGCWAHLIKREPNTLNTCGPEPARQSLVFILIIQPYQRALSAQRRISGKGFATISVFSARRFNQRWAARAWPWLKRSRSDSIKHPRVCRPHCFQCAVECLTCALK